MRFVVQLLQNYLSQTIPSIIITLQSQKYIINVPSSFQRFLNSHKCKLPRGANYFFTKTSTQTIAGLTGLMLTIYDNGLSLNSKLFVDQKMFAYLEDARHKMGFKILPYSYCTWSGLYQLGINDSILIKKIIANSDQNYDRIVCNLRQQIDCMINNKILPIEAINDCRKILKINQNGRYFNDGEIKIIPFQIVSKGQLITNYLIIPNNVKGKVNPDKAQNFGIHKKMIAKLLLQGYLQLETGQIIKAQQIKEPDPPSPNILILHYNCIQSIKQINQNPFLSKYLSDPNNFTSCIVHLVEHAEIVMSEQFRVLLHKFPPPSQHLLFNRFFKDNTDTINTFLSQQDHLKFVSQLSQQFPKAMPNINKIQLDFNKKHFQKCINVQQLFPESLIQTYKSCYQFNILPTQHSGYKEISKLDKQYKQILFQNLKIKPIMQLQDNSKWLFQEWNPKVIFLGTGSMKPSKYRNVSCILLEVDQSNAIMLDCGEGSYQQLFNHYGSEHIQKILVNIRIIFITHIHSDHNLGILDLISNRNRLLRDKGYSNDKLFLIIPQNVFPWFYSYCSKVQNLMQGCQILFIQSLTKQQIDFQNNQATMSKDKIKQQLKCVKNPQQQEQQQVIELKYSQIQIQLLKQYQCKQTEIWKKFMDYLGILEIQQFMPIPVLHCPQSYGIIVEHKSKIKISYSGDTRPIEHFAKAASNSTLLIHQATFGEDLAFNAQTHMHSTVKQALQIGIKSSSWKTALTHFSQRYKSAKEIVKPSIYKKQPSLQEYATHHSIVCFDHLYFNLKDAQQIVYVSRNISSIIPTDSNQ